MGLYEQFKEIDVLGPVADNIHQDLLKVGRKLDFSHEPRAKIKAPFINISSAWDRQCAIWQGIYWQRYHFVSKGCQNCWKIVAKPKTLRELMRILKLQKEIGLPSKCGMEKRPFTSGIYSAFWYCPIKEGLGGARKLWKEIKGKVDEDVGEGIDVILKRA